MESKRNKMKQAPVRITEPIRTARLRRPLAPSVTKDRDIPGFALHVTGKRGFWALSYQPKGLNPSTGKRWGGGVRHELGDALLMPVSEARTAALEAKARVRAGGSPHHERMASTASAVALRAVLASTVAEALDTYAAALMARRQPSESTRRKTIHYARKAIRLMHAENLALAAIDVRAVRLMVETMKGSDGERHLVFRGLDRFLAWCVKQELIERNPCGELDGGEKPRNGRSRDHVPSLEELRAVKNAVENEPQCRLVRFMLTTPLRRDEAAGLRWSEVDLKAKRIRIPATRMKNHELHELPLSPPALELLEACKVDAVGELVFPSANGRPYNGFHTLLARIRARIGKGDAAKAERFTLHDIRRSFASLLAERGFDVDLLDAMLAHKRRGVLGVYQRASRMAERERALKAWADLVTGEARESGQVIALRA
jgi:integrase